MSNGKGVGALRNAFLAGVHSVQPNNLISKWLKRQGDALIIGNKKYVLRSTYIVGFGKGVGGMVPYIVNTLSGCDTNYIKEGILSVPQGYVESPAFNKDFFSAHNIRFYEGGKLNLPDLAAQATAEKIVDLVDRLNTEDLLLVLISGGGSALLPLPLAPLTLSEKIDVIKSMSLAGASITEINAVRKALSAVKGGKLALRARCQVVSFILSDIIDSPLEMIASGPTVLSTGPVDSALKLMEKYNVPLTDNIKCALRSPLNNRSKASISNVYNILIGDNNTALDNVREHFKRIKELNCTPIIITSRLQGEAKMVGKQIASLAFVLLRILAGQETDTALVPFCDNLSIPESHMNELKRVINLVTLDPGQSLCLVFGGETTVQVTGRGKGGRNQEMVLAASLEIEKLSKTNGMSGEVVFLSGGTDGQDGPTDAAGAMTYYSHNTENIRFQTKEAREQNLCPEDFLYDNNSYEYFSRLSDGRYLLKPGHTGTNVMDLQLLYIRRS